MTTRNLFLSALTGFVMVAAANAIQKPVDISALANGNWCAESLLNCATLPFGKRTYGGVLFNIPGDASANNAWFAHTAAGGGTGKVSVRVPVNVSNVKTVYMLMNTMWGSTQPGLLSVTFTGSKGTIWTYKPVGGRDIRDYNQGVYTDSIACQLPAGAGKAATVNAWTNGKGQRLDMQIVELPVSFSSQILVSITITDDGSPLVQRSFLSAVTVSTSLP